MRIYVPADAGLGAQEIHALKRLSRPSLQIIANELTEPGSHEAIRWILRQRDPEKALAQAITENVNAAISAHLYSPNAGMGDLLGKSFFKKLHNVFKKVLITMPKKVLGKVGKIDPIAKALKPTLKKVATVVRKNLPIIITVAGGVLAPFTGGASLAAAAVLVTARQLYAAKIDAHKALVAGKKEAGAMQAQVDQQTADVTKQADDVYHNNQDIFLAAGYDEAKWNALTLDQKIDLIQKASDGKLQPTPQAVDTQQQVQQAAAAGATSASQQYASGSSGGGGYQYGGSPPEYGDVPSGQDVQDAPPSAPQAADSAPAAAASPAPASTSTSSSPLMWLLLAGGVVAVAGSKGKK